MNPLDFADKYLYPYKIAGQEIKAKHCPICHGGPHRDKDTFAINVDNMTFNCKRGSCGVKGTFNQLLKEFDEETFNQDYRIFHFEKKKKEYKKPQVKSKPLTQPVFEYFKSRGISEETVKKCRVGVNEKNAIMFPYFKNGELVLVKYRGIDKKIFWRTTDSEPVFWGLDEITDFEKPLIIFEGEIDRLSAVECGIENTVSVPSGSEDLECIENQWDTLEKFKSIIIWNDNDAPGIEMRNKIISRLGEDRCKYIEMKYKDCNELLKAEGNDAVIEAYKTAKSVPINWAMRLEDLEEWNPDDQTFIKSGIGQIDESLGGFALGTVSIISGKNGSGKSTAVNLFISESVDQGYKTMVFSGETQSQILRYQLELLFAGDSNITKKTEPNKPTKYYVSKDVKQKQREWYKEMIWVYDNIEADCTADGILKNMRTLYRRHNVKHFVIDNVLSMTWNSQNEWQQLQDQSRFIHDCIIFARKYNVAISVIQHPIKKNDRITKDDIKGTGDITNRAHAVILVHKLNSDDRKAYAKAMNEVYEAINWNVDIEIAKNRHNGKTPTCNVYYEDSSRRLRGTNDTFNKKYGWEYEDLF